MPPPDIAPGSRFGAYEVVRVVGRGAFGTVYEALRMPLRKRVALKVLSASMAQHREAAARFLREAEAAAQLAHPHIVDVQDLGEVDGLPYLSMEFLEGETLAARIARCGPLAVSDTADLLLPILSAVATVHERGIIHRDLKPENIFLAHGLTGDHPKLLDFGIAKVEQLGANITRTSALLGTPCYMSPEQVRDAKNIDGRSDIWALGVILYECVTGRRPFDGESSYDVMEQIVRAPIVPPRAYAPALPAAFEAVLATSLQRDPARRFVTARAFGAALLPFAGPLAQATFSSQFGAAPATPSEPTPSWTPAASTGTLAIEAPTLVAQVVPRAAVPAAPAPRRRRGALIATAAVAALLVALAVGVSTRDEPAPVTTVPPPAAIEAPPAEPAPTRAPPVAASPAPARDAPDAAISVPVAPPPPRVRQFARQPARRTETAARAQPATTQLERAPARSPPPLLPPPPPPPPGASIENL